MGAWTEIVDFTFTANETSRTFSGLSIGKGDFLKIVTTFDNNGGNLLRLLPNNSTSTNFHRQQLVGEGSSVSAFRANDTRINFNDGTAFISTSVAYAILSENDRFNTFANHLFRNDSGLAVWYDYSTSSGATFTTGITSLTLQAASTNGIGTGTRIQIYRLDAEKVADITTTANATQVDISSLSIGKDSEYLLVSDVLNGSTGGNLSLRVNDITSGYNAQVIGGNGTSPLAARESFARFMANSGNSRGITYTHIKLSEIGAYTSQSYELRNVGTSSVRIENDFLSSTAENITSITKLNIVHPSTNNIVAGSRFILYKLK
jgi:hypothetical protein